MHRLAALIAVVAALAVWPAAARAQDNPFLPEQPGQQQAPSLPQGPPTPAPVAEDDGGDGMGPAVAIAIALAVVALVGGIWLAITRDARQHAPRRGGRPAPAQGPDLDRAGAPGARGRHHTRSSGGGRRLSRQEKKRRKRGRAR